MPDTGTPAIFDGHNDTLLRLHRRTDFDPVAAFLDGVEGGHIDLPRARAGGLGGGMFAMFSPSPKGPDDPRDEMRGESYDLPLPAQIDAAYATEQVMSMASLLLRIERASDGKVRVCRSASELRECFRSGVLAAVMHIEGAEAIDPDFKTLEVLHQAGLRSIGPVWSRPTIFGHGVPFRYPDTPDTGPGLTDHGFALVKACNELNLVVDLSHLNEAGFWDVARTSDAPLIATHSNAHVHCANTRNLTDRQLAAIRESGGLVGVNFATSFLRADGQMDAQTGLDVMLRHFDHLIEHVGIDGVGFGSDFDGATIPGDIGDAAGLGTFRDAMRAHGYDDATMAKLCHENWFDVLERTWGH